MRSGRPEWSLLPLLALWAACAPEGSGAGGDVTDAALPDAEPGAPDAPFDPSPAECPGASPDASPLLLGPYLQSATPRSVWVLWETAGGEESRVDWGPTEALGRTTCGAGLEAPGGQRHHEVRLEGLEPATRYHYQVRTGATRSDVFHLVTPPVDGSEAGFRLVAVGDGQRDDDHPDKWREVVEEGVVAYVTDELGADLAAELGLLLVAGDLVDNGWFYDQWREQFFAPGAALLPYVPVYPVLGNHEGNSPYYFWYFHLPENGAGLEEEHWWTTRYSNVVIVGLDSNEPFPGPPQLAWLDGVLEEACADDGVDFVLAMLHHPYLSELWPPGEQQSTGDVVAALEAFSSECDKPSVHLFGHTHGYARGQSRDHQHLWVNVSTAGGAIDDWGEYEHVDYDEITVTQDEWGFVLVEISAGDEPSLRVLRVSRGSELVPRDNEVRDDVTIRRYAHPPDPPEAAAAQAPCDQPATLVASAYSDPDGEPLQASHWQVSEGCAGFDTLVHEAWRQSENWWFGEGGTLRSSSPPLP